jgi:hypothetical protein
MSELLCWFFVQHTQDDDEVFKIEYLKDAKFDAACKPIVKIDVDARCGD